MLTLNILRLTGYFVIIPDRLCAGITWIDWVQGYEVTDHKVEKIPALFNSWTS